MWTRSKREKWDRMETVQSVKASCKHQDRQLRFRESKLSYPVWFLPQAQLKNGSEVSRLSSEDEATERCATWQNVKCVLWKDSVKLKRKLLHALPMKMKQNQIGPNFLNQYNKNVITLNLWYTFTEFCSIVLCIRLPPSLHHHSLRNKRFMFSECLKWGIAGTIEIPMKCIWKSCLNCTKQERN